MTAEIAAFRWVPPFAQGFVRDLRLRWALEEAGLPYRVTLIGLEDRASEQYRRWQPFGQVPAYRDDEVELFESGAILLHIADKSEVLSPPDVAGRARMTSWVIAALNSIEPQSVSFIQLDDSAGEDWANAHRERVEAGLMERLAALSAWLGEKDWLEDRFTAGDLIMTTVLRELVESGMLARFPNLDAYRARCEARPGFAVALEAQLHTFRDNTPT